VVVCWDYYLAQVLDENVNVLLCHKTGKHTTMRVCLSSVLLFRFGNYFFDFVESAFDTVDCIS